MGERSPPPSPPAGKRGRGRPRSSPDGLPRDQRLLLRLTKRERQGVEAIRLPGEGASTAVVRVLFYDDAPSGAGGAAKTEVGA